MNPPVIHESFTIERTCGEDGTAGRGGGSIGLCEALAREPEAVSP